jgi:hypothetical protein
MAKEYSQRPSSLLGLADDSYAAWCVDEVAYIWGRHVEGSMAEAEAKAKGDTAKFAARQRALSSLLAGPVSEDQEKTTKGRFRDPASFLNGGGR